MKYLEERKDFVKNEELKRRYQQEGREVPAEEFGNQLNNLLTRNDFIESDELREKYGKEQSTDNNGVKLNLSLFNEEKCLSFSECRKRKEM